MMNLKPISVLTEADLRLYTLEKLFHYQYKATSRVEMAKTKVKNNAPGSQEDLRHVEHILILIENEINRKKAILARANAAQGCAKPTCGSCGDCKVS